MTIGEEPYISRLYCGLYEKEMDAKNNVTKDICYIAGAKGITAVYMNEQMYYLRRDHQGSITGLIDQGGKILEEYSYDAWGRRRNHSDWTYDNAPVPQYLYRGYTFHEHMDEFGLINMNGRAYDPIVGRFLNPDPLIQNTANTQNYNRYSYCLNNPLKYTDPSGYTYIHNEKSAFKFRGHINRDYENFLYKSGCNGALWEDGTLYAICAASGLGGGNGLGNTIYGEMTFLVTSISWDLNYENMFNKLSNAMAEEGKINSADEEKTKAEFELLMGNGDYTGAVDLVLNFYALEKNVMSSGSDVVILSITMAADQTQLRKEMYYNSNTDGIELNAGIQGASYGAVVRAAYHECIHAYQDQRLGMIGFNPIKDVMAYYHGQLYPDKDLPALREGENAGAAKNFNRYYNSLDINNKIIYNRLNFNVVSRFAYYQFTDKWFY